MLLSAEQLTATVDEIRARYGPRGLDIDNPEVIARLIVQDYPNVEGLTPQAEYETVIRTFLPDDLLRDFRSSQMRVDNNRHPIPPGLSPAETFLAGLSMLRSSPLAALSYAVLVSAGMGSQDALATAGFIAQVAGLILTVRSGRAMVQAFTRQRLPPRIPRTAWDRHTVASNLSRLARRTNTSDFVIRSRGQVTAQLLLEWEQAGGHTLARHSWQLTRQQLFQRIPGGTEVGAPRSLSDGRQSPDFRVWRGGHAGAASKWADESTMQRALGDVIHSNITEIRDVIGRGGQWTGERLRTGYRTGSGWLTTGATGQGAVAERAAFWQENLDGVTIVIRSRPGAAPNQESWYVHTAHPDLAF